MTLLELFDWLEQSALGGLVRDSIWLFPVIEAAHLLGLATLGGAVLLVDLRLLGFGIRDRPTSYTLEQTRPYLLGAITVMFATGIPLFLSEALKCYWSPAFWLKMGALVAALLFTFAVRNRLVCNSPDLSPWQCRAIASTSITTWLLVAGAGRWIGFS